MSVCSPSRIRRSSSMMATPMGLRAVVSLANSFRLHDDAFYFPLNTARVRAEARFTSILKVAP